jgi:hypothetical protein
MSMGPPAGIDHLVFAAPTLEAGIGEVEVRLGVRPVRGGRHPAFGTHNALVALGPEVYLEVIAPDPSLPSPPRGVGFGASAVDRPRLVTWALRTNDIQASAGVAGLGGVESGERELEDGSILRWLLSDPYAERCDGLIPFLIDWTGSPHPAGSAPPGGHLTSFRLRHPKPHTVRARLTRLGLDLAVTEAAEPGLVAVIDSPTGRVELS